jgi:hypothetical protein
MVDIAVDVLDAKGASGARFVANNAEGAAALALIVADGGVEIGQEVWVDGWVYKNAVEKLRAVNAKVLVYTELQYW